MRAILDVNVLISAVLSADGAPARAVRAWAEGRFELIVSPKLLDELTRALGYAKVRRRIPEAEGRRYVEHLASSATMAEDPDEPPVLASPDPGDDYLLALAETERAYLVSGDRHLLPLGDRVPVVSVARFLEIVSQGTERHPP